MNLHSFMAVFLLSKSDLVWDSGLCSVTFVILGTTSTRVPFLLWCQIRVGHKRNLVHGLNPSKNAANATFWKKKKIRSLCIYNIGHKQLIFKTLHFVFLLNFSFRIKRNDYSMMLANHYLVDHEKRHGTYHSNSLPSRDISLHHSPAHALPVL